MVSTDYSNDIYANGFRGKRVHVSRPAAGVIGAKQTIFYDTEKRFVDTGDAAIPGAAALSEQNVRALFAGVSAARVHGGAGMLTAACVAVACSNGAWLLRSGRHKQRDCG